MSTVHSPRIAADYFPDNESVDNSRTEVAHFPNGRRQTPNLPRKPSTSRSRWILLAVLVYIVLALFCWIVLCIQNYRPLTYRSYSWTDLQDEEFYNKNLDSYFAQNDNYCEASRIITIVLALVTVPLVLVVCSAIKLIYVKRGRQSMRQAIAIADNKRGPIFFITLTLCIFGLLVYLLQLILVSTLSIYTPNYVHTNQGNSVYLSYSFPDIRSSLEGGVVQEDSVEDTPIIAALLKDSIGLSSSSDVLPTLWSHNVSCYNSEYSDPSVLTDARLGFCYSDGNNLADVDPLDFVSSLKYAYNTGLIRQFAPRMNSSVSYEAVQTFSSCESGKGWTTRYNMTYGPPNYYETESYDVEICMPDTTASLQNIYGRQDMTEVLYLKMSLSPSRTAYDRNFSDYTIKITVNTTTGYFELPNYMNNNQPGPLLANATAASCGEDCYDQHFVDNNYLSYNITSTGPLLRVVEVLFGNNSFLDVLRQNPQGFTIPGLTSSNPRNSSITAQLQSCLLPIPMQRFLQGTPSANRGGPLCVGYYDEPFNIAEEWLLNFVNNTVAMQSTFGAMITLSNSIWLNSRNNYVGYAVSRDFGTQHLKPTIALPSIIIISVLLGGLLLSLLILAIYSCQEKSTSTLNSLFMIRLGAMNYRRLGDPNPAVVDAALDEIPGWIEEEKVIVTDDMELN